MKRKINIVFSVVIIITTLLLISGRILTFTESPKQSDAIIVLSGGQGRVEKAAELYKAGYAPYIILSNAKESTSKSGDMVQTALALGIPQDVIYTENAADSTYQNAEYTLPIMKEYGFKSAIVVSSDFHMRRVKFLFGRVYKKSEIELTYVGSASGYNAKRWWSDRKSRETTFNEYVKMIGNTFGYNGPEAKSTLDQIKNWFR
ncbi:YdcF family protein [Paenibacillus sp. FSL H7-0323]|uniref:YdcF family protein n=1 Tax=Paenibacillus sp. FSL H7-0323 TaxID=2921433 RepID=UPI0030FBF858